MICGLLLWAGSACRRGPQPPPPGMTAPADATSNVTTEAAPPSARHGGILFISDDGRLITELVLRDGRHLRLYTRDREGSPWIWTRPPTLTLPHAEGPRDYTLHGCPDSGPEGSCAEVEIEDLKPTDWRGILRLIGEGRLYRLTLGSERDQQDRR